VACDDSVLRSSFGRKAYAICLTRLAEHSVLRRSLSLALGAWERQSEVVRRVHRILQNPRKSMSPRQATLVTSGLVLAVLGGAIALARSPQLVAFAPLTPSSLMAQSMPAVSSLREAGLPSPVLSNSAGAPHMVETAMHLPSAKAVPAAMPVRKLAIKHTVKPPLMQSQQEWVVLTEWTNTEIQPHVVFAVQQTKSAPAAVIRTYAAVPFGNGWLLVQI